MTTVACAVCYAPATGINPIPLCARCWQSWCKWCARHQGYDEDLEASVQAWRVEYSGSPELAALLADLDPALQIEEDVTCAPE